MGKIICSCGFRIFDGLILKIRVGQFSKGYMNLKCKRCSRFINGLNIKLLTGEIEEDVDFRESRRNILKEKEVYLHDSKRSHNEYP